MAEHTDNWGTLDEVLKEVGPAGALAGQQPFTHEGGRAFLRWMFSALEAFTFCLKRITVEHVERGGVALSQREKDLLVMLKEPSFPGQPPPRRIEFSLRETLGVTINVYARARRKESPLLDGRLPTVFVDASLIHDRLEHPETPDDLHLTATELLGIIEFFEWFKTIHAWLYQDRAVEIQELGFSDT